jgi:hypothetical protein
MAPDRRRRDADRPPGREARLRCRAEPVSRAPGIEQRVDIEVGALRRLRPRESRGTVAACTLMRTLAMSAGADRVPFTIIAGEHWLVAD